MPGVVDVFESIEETVLMEIFQAARTEIPKTSAMIANTVATQVRNYWKQMAESASAWGGRYAGAVDWEPMGDGGGSARVFLDEDHPGALFAHMVEEGVRSWSIKDALLASQRAKTSTAGIKYIVVPFRWRTPSETKATSSFAGVMPDSVYEIAKAGGTVSAAQADAAGNPNLAGLRKYGGPPHSTYFTFRCVTERSTGWVYPQKAATPVFPKAVEYAKQLIAKTLSDFVADYAAKLEGKYGG